MNWPLDLGTDKVLKVNHQSIKSFAMPCGSGSSTKFSHAKRDRFRALGVEIASVETRALSLVMTEDLPKIAGQLVEEAFPFPVSEEDPRRLFPLPHHPAHAVLLVDNTKQEDYENVVFGDTMFALANNVLWQIAQAVEVCQSWRRESKRPFGPVLHLFEKGDYLRWETATKSVSGRPGVSRAGTADFTLWLRNESQSARHRILALVESKPSLQPEHLESLCARCEKPLSGSRLKLTESGAEWRALTKGPTMQCENPWMPVEQSHHIVAQCASQLLAANVGCGALLFDHGRGFLEYELVAEDILESRAVTAQNLAHKRHSTLKYTLAFSNRGTYGQHEQTDLVATNTAAVVLEKTPAAPLALAMFALKALGQHNSGNRPFPTIESDDIFSLDAPLAAAPRPRSLASISECAKIPQQPERSSTRKMPDRSSGRITRAQTSSSSRQSNWRAILVTRPWSVAAAPFARGVTSDIYELRLGTQEEICALKVLREDDLNRVEVEALREVVQTELNALSTLEAANCRAAPQLRGTLAPTAEPISTSPKIATTFVEGLTLDRFFYEVARRRGWLKNKRDEQIWKDVFYSVRQPALLALQSVHAAGWIHGDLHARNIIVQGSPDQILSTAQSSESSWNDDELVNVVFVDWGSSKPKDEESSSADFMALNDTIFYTWRDVLLIEDDYM
ncbi:unnamed protein product [Sympodiomycopsis kandeliae]